MIIIIKIIIIIIIIIIIHLSTLRPFLSTWNVTWKNFFLIKTIHSDHNARNGNHQYFENNFSKNVTITATVAARMRMVEID